MTKFIAKQIAKKYIENHQHDDIKTNLIHNTIRGIEFYQDVPIYIILYIVLFILFVIGIPVGVLFLTDYSIWWTILSFFGCFVGGIIISIKLAKSFILSVKKEIEIILNKFSENGKGR